MTKICLYAALLFGLLAAVFGVLNKSKMTAKQAEIEATQTRAQAAQQDASKAKTAQKAAEKAASDAVAKSNELQTQLDNTVKEAGELKTKVETASNDLESQKKLVADLQDKLSKVPQTPQGVPVSTDVVAQFDKAKHDLAELEVVKDGLDGQLKVAQTQVSQLQGQIRKREQGEMMNGLRGRVLAVDRNWNFVVLDLGGRNGVNSNSTMVVERGGSMVGRIKITSVEPSQSIADIVPNSVPAGISVQPGDTVVFPGT